MKLLSAECESESECDGNFFVAKDNNHIIHISGDGEDEKSVKFGRTSLFKLTNWFLCIFCTLHSNRNYNLFCALLTK